MTETPAAPSASDDPATGWYALAPEDVATKLDFYRDVAPATSADTRNQPFSSEHRRALSRRRAIAPDCAREAQTNDQSTEIGGLTSVRATTPSWAAAAWNANDAGGKPTSCVARRRATIA